MEHDHPLANAELLTEDRPFVSEIPKLKKLAISMGLSGLANNTKWNELITTIRNSPDSEWRPSFRYNCIDSEFISTWDCEWWHHLPFPFVSVRWFEVSFMEEIHRGNLISPEVKDHSEKLKSLLESIGLEFERGKEAFRIYGYSPIDHTDFE